MNTIEVFKTNVQQQRQAEAVIDMLIKHFPLCQASFDLSDCDKILRLEGQNICPQSTIELLNANGYQCEVLV